MEQVKKIISAPYDVHGFKSGITKIMLENFRSYRSFSVQCDTRPVVIIGKNGSGKTSLLEAISLFAPGRGLRGAKLNEITNQGMLHNYLKQRAANDSGRPNAWDLSTSYITSGPLWSASIQLQNDDQKVLLGTGLVQSNDSSSDKRIIHINEANIKNQGTLTEWLGITWITPQMNHLFTEPATARRKFIDRLVCTFDSDHTSRLNRYDYHIRERSILLKQGRYDEKWVQTLEEKIAQDGVSIEIARTLLLEKLNNPSYQSENSVFPKFQANMIGSTIYWNESMSSLEAEESLAAHLKQQRPYDAQYGGASVGPHRNDLNVIYLAKQLSADICSTGEQKMLLIAILLAFARVQTQLQDILMPKPLILLLDDIVAHLDALHRTALFEEIYQLNLQAWLTGTEYNVFEELGDRSQFFHLHESTLTKGLVN